MLRSPCICQAFSGPLRHAHHAGVLDVRVRRLEGKGGHSSCGNCTVWQGNTKHPHQRPCLSLCVNVCFDVVVSATSQHSPPRLPPWWTHSMRRRTRATGSRTSSTSSVRSCGWTSSRVRCTVMQPFQTAHVMQLHVCSCSHTIQTHNGGGCAGLAHDARRICFKESQHSDPYVLCILYCDMGCHMQTRATVATPLTL
jgi:hypothetical protein